MRWFFTKSDLEVSVFGVILACIFPPFFFFNCELIRRDTLYLSVFSPNTRKCVKNADQNNSEYELFLRSENLKWSEDACFSIKIYPKSLVYLGHSQTFTMVLFTKKVFETNVFFTTLHLCTENEVSY